MAYSFFRSLPNISITIDNEIEEIFRKTENIDNVKCPFEQTALFFYKGSFAEMISLFADLCMRQHFDVLKENLKKVIITPKDIHTELLTNIYY